MPEPFLAMYGERDLVIGITGIPFIPKTFQHVLRETGGPRRIERRGITLKQIYIFDFFLHSLILCRGFYAQIIRDGSGFWFFVVVDISTMGAVFDCAVLGGCSLRDSRATGSAEWRWL